MMRKFTLALADLFHSPRSVHVTVLSPMHQCSRDCLGALPFWKGIFRSAAISGTWRPLWARKTRSPTIEDCLFVKMADAISPVSGKRSRRQVWARRSNFLFVQFLSWK